MFVKVANMKRFDVNFQVTCGPVGNSGRRRKRSTDEDFLVQISFEMKIPFEDGPAALQVS